MSETKFSPEIATKIQEMYADGKTISEIAKTIGVDMLTIQRWKLKYPEFSEVCSQAQEAGFEVQVDKLLNIFDYYPDPNQARVMSDNTKWVVGKRSPQKYGDKLTLDINQTIDIKSALLEAKQRIGIQAPSQIEQASSDRDWSLETKRLYSRKIEPTFGGALLEAKQRIGIQAPSQIEQAIDVTPENLITETDNKSVDDKTKDAEINELEDLLK